MSKTKTTVKDVTRWFVDQELFFCSLCGNLLFADEEIQWDHIHSEGMGGAHTYKNLRPVHAGCHKKKTKADVQALAKVDRITGVTGNGPKREIKSRPFMKGKRKMRSRSSFQRRPIGA